MQNIQLIRQYGAGAVAAMIALFLARGFFTDVGRRLWQASTATVKGWVVVILVSGAFGCVAQAAIVAYVPPYDPQQAILFIAAAIGLLAVATGMVLSALLSWLDLIASIQRGEPPGQRKRIAPF